MPSIREQVHRNAVALISLAVAVGSLAYNTWRNETTEEQRNLRHASFRVLESLGELQEVVDYRYYYLPFERNGAAEGASRLRGFGNVTMVRDLMNLMPPPAPEAGDRLHRLWGDKFGSLDDLDEADRHTAPAQAAERELTQSVNEAREAVILVLKSLE